MSRIEELIDDMERYILKSDIANKVDKMVKDNYYQESTCSNTSYDRENSLLTIRNVTSNLNCHITFGTKIFVNYIPNQIINNMAQNILNIKVGTFNLMNLMPLLIYYKNLYDFSEITH